MYVPPLALLLCLCVFWIDRWQEELRMTAAALLNDLAESLGNDLCKQFVTPEMVSLSEVRKSSSSWGLGLGLELRVIGQ